MSGNNLQCFSGQTNISAHNLIARKKMNKKKKIGKTTEIKIKGDMLIGKTKFNKRGWKFLQRLLNGK